MLCLFCLCWFGWSGGGFGAPGDGFLNLRSRTGLPLLVLLSLQPSPGAPKPPPDHPNRQKQNKQNETTLNFRGQLL